MPIAIVITVLGLGLILAGALWRQQTAPRRLILIAVGIFLLLLGGWKLLQAQDDARRAQPRSWSAEPAASPNLSVAFGPEDLPEAEPKATTPKPVPSSSKAESAPVVTREAGPPAKPMPRPAVQPEAQTEPERRPLVAAQTEPVAPPPTESSVRPPRRGSDLAARAKAPRNPAVAKQHREGGEACCRWLPAEGGYANESQRAEADVGPAPGTSYAPAPAYREASPCDVGRTDVQGGVCVEIRNALGQGQRSESLQVFVEGRPVGRFDLDQARPSQSLAVWLSYPGRFGYRLVGHVDYADGRYALNSQGVFDARPGSALDVRITPWRDQVFLELDPWSADVSSAR